jgi:2-alkenal reductase
MTIRRSFLLSLTGLALAPALEAQVPAPPADPRPSEPRSISSRGGLAPDEQRVVSLFENAAPSVAYITTETVRTNIWLESEVSRGAGSGFVWDRQADGEGHIVTNNHVIANARRVLVQLDAGEPIEGVVVGRAPEYDLAVIRLAKIPANVRPIPLGDSRSLKIGQTVFAIGNPFGLQRTLTQGIVSALDRELPTTTYREVVGVIQTDAAINPGNSGGPLMDSAGRLVGVNTAIRSASGASAGIGFSIPSDLVNRIVPLLISRGRAPVPGVGITPVRPDLVARAGIKGIVLARIDPQGPAAQAGLQPFDARSGEVGDVIIAVNGRAVTSLTHMVTELDRVGVGSTAELTVLRNNQKTQARTVRVKVVDLRP